VFEAGVVDDHLAGRYGRARPPGAHRVRLVVVGPAVVAGTSSTWPPCRARRAARPTPAGPPGEPDGYRRQHLGASTSATGCGRVRFSSAWYVWPRGAPVDPPDTHRQRQRAENQGDERPGLARYHNRCQGHLPGSAGGRAARRVRRRRGRRCPRRRRRGRPARSVPARGQVLQEPLISLNAPPIADAEHALPALQQVDDLLRRAALVDRGAGRRSR